LGTGCRCKQAGERAEAASVDGFFTAGAARLSRFLRWLDHTAPQAAGLDVPHGVIPSATDNLSIRCEV
jgi:hypothetical protein